MITPQFDDAQQFLDGIAPVRTGTRRGYVDIAGKYVWAPVAPAAPIPPEEESDDYNPLFDR